MTELDVKALREHLWAVYTMLLAVPMDWEQHVTAAKARMYANRLTALAVELVEYAEYKEASAP